MSQEAQIFAVHETCQSVKEKYPGLKHKGDSDFTLNPHEAFQGCHFSAVRGTGLRSHWEPLEHPSVPPAPYLLSFTNKGQLAHLRQLGAAAAPVRSVQGTEKPAPRPPTRPTVPGTLLRPSRPGPHQAQSR